MTVTSSYKAFFERAQECKTSLLLLDYDGTLAPFTVERTMALPYPGVMEELREVLHAGGTRVIFVSGRPAHDLASLLKPYGLNCEIWGTHGRERLLVDGTYQEFHSDPQVPGLLERACELLQLEGVGKQIELKPGALALHWRGLGSVEKATARTAALRAFAFLRTKTDCSVVGFDGGIELLIGSRGKGDVVRSVIEEVPYGTAVAYLGDDLTDEDAFLALRDIGLSVLVRPEYRPTNAEVWIKPPEELIAFLKNWSRISGGKE